jgi:hypothetical protein
MAREGAAWRRFQEMPAAQIRRRAAFSTPEAASLSEQLKKLPPSVRSIVQAARRTVKAAAPNATEITSQSEPPRSKTYMWKLVRYKVDGRDVVGIGAFTAPDAERPAVARVVRKAFKLGG